MKILIAKTIIVVIVLFFVISFILDIIETAKASPEKLLFNVVFTLFLVGVTLWALNKLEVKL